MDRLVLAVSSDKRNSRITANSFLNAFLLEDGKRIAEIRVIIEGGELHAVVKGLARKVKLGLYNEEE